MWKKLLVTITILLAVGIACREGGETATATELRAETRTAIPPTVSVQRRTPVVVAAHSILPAVVNIETAATIRRRGYDPFWGFFGDRPYQTSSVGSGFVWASDGTIVTNAHVVEGASEIKVNLFDRRQLDATVIGVDPDSDLAVLQVEASGLPAAPIGTSSDLLIGETVIAVGNPFGLSGSVTTGVVSATGRTVPSKERGRIYTDFIQTDASINPGNSGGPLLNIEGKVVGINVAIYADAQNIGFAIPVDRARKVIEDLRRYGSVHPAWVGVATATVTPEEARRADLAAERGALVTRVFSGSPAERAGIAVGDVIVAVGNSPVDSRESFNTQVASATPGRPLSLRVQRGRRTLAVPVTPIDPPRELGLEILRTVAGIGVEEGRRGVVIDRVQTGSHAAGIGLRPGDAIVGVNGRRVASVEELNAEVIRGADRSSIVLSVARGRFVYTLTFPMEGERTEML